MDVNRYKCLTNINITLVNIVTLVTNVTIDTTDILVTTIRLVNIVTLVTIVTTVTIVTIVTTVILVPTITLVNIVTTFIKDLIQSLKVRWKHFVSISLFCRNSNRISYRFLISPYLLNMNIHILYKHFLVFIQISTI